MGTTAHVLVGGIDATELTETAGHLLHDLEQAWSRFLPDSEISRLNRRETMVVSPSTLDLVTKALQGHALTDGRFDPTLGDRLIELGYDRSFDRLALDPGTGTGPDEGERPRRYGHPFSVANDAARIEIDAVRSSVLLPLGTSFDPGGIGKGLAADIVSRRLLQRGATGVMVNVGGDLRVRGRPPEGDRWTISIREPAVADKPLATVQLLDGAVATSTTARRRWADDRHHLIDPDTDLPTGGPLLTTVVAGAGWWAEVAATALMTGYPTDLDCCAALRVHRDDDGLTFERRGPFERYEIDVPLENTPVGVPA